MQDLKEMNWIDNRTRALIVEFSVYNAQTEYITVAKIAAEFVGGGVVTKYRSGLPYFGQFRQT